MNVLRDYIAFEFETSNVVADSPFDLERTIDDFVFMTFFVGNDFLPAMPALDIADEAFDLLWYTYRDHRQKWLEEKGTDPYLTSSGNIVSGKRLEAFLAEVGSFEGHYYDNKKEVEDETNRRIRIADEKWGRSRTSLSFLYHVLSRGSLLSRGANKATFRSHLCRSNNTSQ